MVKLLSHCALKRFICHQNKPELMIKESENTHTNQDSTLLISAGHFFSMTQQMITAAEERRKNQNTNTEIYKTLKKQKITIKSFILKSFIKM